MAEYPEMMGPPEELWDYMHGVSSAAKHDRIKGPIRGLGQIANDCLEMWRTDHKLLVRFAEKSIPLLPIQTHVFTQAGHLETAEALERLHKFLFAVLQYF